MLICILRDMALRVKSISPLPLTGKVTPSALTEPPNWTSAVRSPMVFCADARTSAAGCMALVVDPPPVTKTRIPATSATQKATARAIHARPGPLLAGVCHALT